MSYSEQLTAARDQLNRILTFFPRVDGKASVLLAVNTSMLALLATRAFPYTQLSWEIIPIGLTLGFLSLSFWHLYHEAFPVLEGGQQSLIYFREIAARTEARYIEAWKRMSEEEYLEDMLGQVWRNSEILKKKFDHIRLAFIFLSLAIVPWLVSLAALSWEFTY